MSAPKGGEKRSPHCRVCGYTPHLPKLGEPDLSIEKVVEHLDVRHPYDVLGLMTEAAIVFRQMQGDDSRCEFHGGGQ
jgi:hypothetical protein